MANVTITVHAGTDGEALSFEVSEENYLPGDIHNLLARAYARAVQQAQAWENPNATQRP